MAGATVFSWRSRQEKRSFSRGCKPDFSTNWGQNQVGEGKFASGCCSTQLIASAHEETFSFS